VREDSFRVSQRPNPSNKSNLSSQREGPKNVLHFIYSNNISMDEMFSFGSLLIRDQKRLHRQSEIY